MLKQCRKTLVFTLLGSVGPNMGTILETKGLTG